MAMRAGKAIRELKALQHAGDKLCGCGHTMREHRELYPTILRGFSETGPIEEPNPDYAPLIFHCHHDGCDCTIDRRNG